MANQTVTSPEQFFGFRLGDDRKIARWDRIIEYYELLAAESDRIKVMDLGPSTEGNRFLLVIISSPDNLARLEELRQISLKLSDPRGLDEAAARTLAQSGKAIVCQTMSLHANEIGGTQMAPELAYEMIAGDTPEIRRVLDKVVFLLIPCFNPDGQIAVTDWYNRHLGTEYEGTGLPWLYHKYAGHDNNRDAVALNLIESAYIAKLMLRDWMPQVYQDHHHMGGAGIRFYVAPYTEPIRPHADPIVWREISWYGSHIAYLLEEQDKQGVINGAHWTAWGHLGFHRLTELHNIAGLLTESASAKLATPAFVHPEQLKGANPKTHPEYAAQTNFPNPWPGGWWRLRDIVEQQKISAWAVLDLAARYRQTVLWNAYLKARRQTEIGKAGKVSAYVISPEQHDPWTARRLVDILLGQGIEVLASDRAVTLGGTQYPAGTCIVPLAQPKRGVIINLLERTIYPDGYWTRTPDGAPVVYDLATDTISEYMGVHVARVEEPIAAPPQGAHRIAAPPASECGFIAGRAGYLLDARSNGSYLAANRLVDRGIPVVRLETATAVGCGRALPPGSFYVPGGKTTDAACDELAQRDGVEFCPTAAAPDGPTQPFRRLRIGLYQRYWGGNMAEGWTRHVLESFGFPYRTVMDEPFHAGHLGDELDVLILPDDRSDMIIGPGRPGGKGAGSAARFSAMPVPPEYRSGIGEIGLTSLADFVRGGGRVVALAEATALVTQALGLKVRNLTEGLDPRTYFCKGSTLWVDVDTTHRLAYGMPARALVLNVQSPVFEVLEGFHAQDYAAVVRYERDPVQLMQSGWLIGADRIAGKTAMLAAKAGDGEAVLIGFPSQFRAQTHGTFKLLFNSLC
jgi:hypothetical protein